MNNPKKIKLNKEENTLDFEWDNGAKHSIPIKYLRDESPDAGNKGETILWTHYPAPDQGPDKPGKYDVAGIKKVGGYAITIKWGDGYDYGIFSWDLLYKWGEFFEVKRNIKNVE